jgi:hypothetical protein
MDGPAETDLEPELLTLLKAVRDGRITDKGRCQEITERGFVDLGRVFRELSSRLTRSGRPGDSAHDSPGVDEV